MSMGRESDAGNDGVFVVIEGIDGAGTTTQASRIASFLRSRRRLVHVTREPSGGPIGSMIRLVLTQRLTMASHNRDEAMALLFAADRLDHVETEIAPLLRDGYVVLSDRYELSSIIYQSAAARDEEERRELVAWIRSCNRYAKRPDVTIVVDVDPAVAEERRRARGGASELFEEPDLQARLARAYLRAEEITPDAKIVHVDGNGDMDSVTAAILKVLGPFVREEV
jgi:dTMP kinase